jgi:hypothetical protein
VAHRSQRRALDVPPQPALAYPRRPELATLVADAAHARIKLDEVARWCAEIGGVDPRLELAALRHAAAIVDLDALVDDLTASLRARLGAAGESRGVVPRVLATLGLDDVDPPDDAMLRELAPRIARFYWQRLRAFVAWRAACAL